MGIAELILWQKNGGQKKKRIDLFAQHFFFPESAAARSAMALARKTTRRRSITAGPGFVRARTVSVCAPAAATRIVPMVGMAELILWQKNGGQKKKRIDLFAQHFF